MKQGMKESYMKGVAIQHGPALCACGGNVTSKMSSVLGRCKLAIEIRNHHFRAPLQLNRGFGDALQRVNRECCSGPGGVEDPMRASKLHARDAGLAVSTSIRRSIACRLASRRCSMLAPISLWLFVPANASAQRRHLCRPPRRRTPAKKWWNFAIASCICKIELIRKSVTIFLRITSTIWYHCATRCSASLRRIPMTENTTNSRLLPAFVPLNDVPDHDQHQAGDRRRRYFLTDEHTDKHQRQEW